MEISGLRKHRAIEIFIGKRRNILDLQENYVMCIPYERGGALECRKENFDMLNMGTDTRPE